MRSDLDRTLATFAVLFASVAAWMIADVNGILASNSRVLIYFLANLMLLFDMLDLIGRIWVKRMHGAALCGPSLDLGLGEISKAEVSMLLAPYAIIVSVHNAADDIDQFLTEVQPFKEHVWLIDDASTDDTLLRLRRLGWNCFDGGTNRNKPGALYHLIKLLPSEIETVLVMDPDVRWEATPAMRRTVLEQVISDLQRSGMAALSPRIKAKRRGWLAECQALEYELSCGLGRKSLGGFGTNSGVSLYRRAALQDALSRHTLSVYAEDLENSLLLLAAGERIYYDDRLVFVTEAKRTLPGLFSQRVGWSFGCAKVFSERLPMVLAVARRGPLGLYQYLFYLGINGIVLMPLKLISVAILAASFLNGVDDLFLTHWVPDESWNEPLLFALWYLKSVVVVVIACVTAVPRGERWRHLSTVPLYPFYALLQYVPMAVGFANLLTMRIFGRRVYADHYDANPRLDALQGDQPATTRS